MASITRTSRSLLFNRVVRVERREKIDDGMGGTYPEYTPIINRYHVWLEPQQHQRRERQELGEQQAGNDYRAGGHPTHNGISIMIGDRFHDVKNNECYDVVAVKRPRPGLAYAAMTHYELRIVKDGCPPPAEVPYDMSAGGGGAGSSQNMFIMRHLGNTEILTWQALPYFDGVVWNLQYDNPDQLVALAGLMAAGRRWWRYYTVLDYPHTATAFGGTSPPLATWFNYLRSNIQFTGGGTSHRRMRVADTVALFAGTGGSGQFRELIPWPTITAPERAALAAQMVALALAPGGLDLPASGIFLDQASLRVFSVHVESNLLSASGHGNVEEGSPKLTALNFAGAVAAFGNGGSWLDYSLATSALYSEVANLLPGRYVIKNGEHGVVNGLSVPNPRMFENAWDNSTDGATQPERWANAKAGFATDPRNILSILCDATPNAINGVPDALAWWQQVGGWISFTDDGSAQGVANREAAYTEAAAVLAAHGWP